MKYLLSALLLLFSCSVFGQEFVGYSYPMIDTLGWGSVDWEGASQPLWWGDEIDLQLTTQQPEKQGYRITKTKLIGWGIVGVAGFVDGAVEGYEFDGKRFFERKYNADPYGFWGSESWRKIYVDGDPTQGCKTVLGCSLGAFDFYHVGDDLRKVGYISGGIVIGIGGSKLDQKFTHTLLDFAIGFAVGAVTKNAGMQYIRSWK